MKLITNSEKETIEFAKKIAKELRGGEIIGLVGDLGAGKTVFSKGVAKEFSIKEMITSPTYVVMKVYDVLKHKTIKKLCHIDAYRLTNAIDIEAIGALEYMERKDTVTIIEWPDKIKKILPDSTIIYNFQIKNNLRIITQKK